MQRVTRAKVVVDGTTVGELPGPGLLVYLGVTHEDGPAEVTWLARKGRRPSWSAAAPGPVSEPLYESFCETLAGLGAHVERGRFGADMAVEAVNDGPVTMILQTP